MSLLATSCIVDPTWVALGDPVYPALPPKNVQDSSLRSVSCPTDDFCLAGGFSDAVAGFGDRYRDPLLQAWDGSTWSAVALPGETPGLQEWSGVLSLDCASPTRCVVVLVEFNLGDDPSDYNFGSEFQAYAWVWDGGAWSDPQPVESGDPADEIPGYEWGEPAVDCAPTGDCFLAARSDDTVAGIRGALHHHDGSGWSSTGHEWGPDIVDVSCVSADVCLVGEEHPTNGRTWVHEVDSGVEQFLFSFDGTTGYLDCFTPTSCIAGDQWWDGIETTDTGAPGTRNTCTTPTSCVGHVGWSDTAEWDGAGPWVATGSSGVPGARAVSCSPGGMCMIVGDDFDDGMAATKQIFAPAAWVLTAPLDLATPPRSLLDRRILDLDCTSRTYCMAVGEALAHEGDAIVTEWKNDGWVEKEYPHTWLLPIDVGCSSTSNCHVTAFNPATGSSMVTRAYATGWTPLLSPPGGDLSRSRVACLPGSWPSCALFGTDTGVYSRYVDGGTWAAVDPATDPDAAIDPACVTLEWCVTFDRFAQPQLVEPADVTAMASTHTAADIVAVACTSTTRCVAVGASPGGDPAAISWDGTTWSDDTVTIDADSSVLNDVDCDTGTYRSCLAIGTATTGGQRTPIAATTYGGGNWQLLDDPIPATNPTSAVPERISCPEDNWCMVVGTRLSGKIEVGFSAELTWDDPE